MLRRFRRLLASWWLLSVCLISAQCQQANHVSQNSGTTLAGLESALRAKASSLENRSGMRRGFEAFLAKHQIAEQSIRYSDFVIVRLYFEATRDAGFWNLHWAITDKPPNSDNIWRQWQRVSSPSTTSPTATAECAELSALFAFLVERTGVKGVGLFWPYPNHIVAVWVVHPQAGSTVRVVVRQRKSSSKQRIFSIPRNSIPGAKRIFMNRRAATCQIRSRFRRSCSISSCGKSTNMPAPPMRRYLETSTRRSRGLQQVR
jgi:hypothetical protein